MKLVLCKNCADVFKCTTKRIRYCECGACSGKYTDNINAWYKGKYAVPLGLDNKSLVEQVPKQPKYGKGPTINAFIINKNCKTFKKKK